MIRSEVIHVEKMNESLMEGLLEDLQEIQLYGGLQGRRTVIESVVVKVSEEAQRTGQISKESCSFSMLKDASD